MYSIFVVLIVVGNVTVLAKDLASANMRCVCVTFVELIMTGELKLVAFSNMPLIHVKLGDWKLIGWLKLEAP